MKGFIVINAFLRPIESVKQAERLKQEFNNLGVEVDVVTDGFLRYSLTDGGIVSVFSGYDFCVYLDKDKYQSLALEKLGLRLFNRHDAIRVCDDKGETYLALTDSGISMPNTIFGALCYSEKDEIKREWAERIGAQLGFPVIVKESFGSMGKGVYKADTQDELFSLMNTLKLKPHLYQKYLGAKKGEDVRIIVIGKKAVAGMIRRNSVDFRSNVAQGGETIPIALGGEETKIAEKVAEILGLDYCGIDLLTGDDGNLSVCEVNSNAFFEGLEKAMGVNVAKAYAEYIIDQINSRNIQ